MAQVTEHQVLEVLRQVREPESGEDIVSRGMVSGVVVRDGNVGFAIEVDPRRGPKLEPMRAEAERIVQAMAGVVSVTAVLTAPGSPGPLVGWAGSIFSIPNSWAL